MGLLWGIVGLFCGYWIGKFTGVKEAFDILEKEGRIIKKDELKNLMK